MCLTSSSRYHPVMSSGDPSVVPSSTPIPDSKVAPSSTEQDDNSPGSSLNVEVSTDKANFSISDSDLRLHEQSMGPSNDSLENMTPILIRGEVTSLDAISLEEEVGELLKSREARSAFEITSFRPNPDELDKSVRNPVSTDSLHVVKGESGGSVESMIAVIAGSSPNEKQHTAGAGGESSSQTAPDRANFVIGEDPGSVEAQSEAIEDGASQGGINSSPKMVLVSDDQTAGKMSPHPGGSAAAPPVNGASVQPNRFRRVNQYERGRWTVRDSLVTEEATLQKQQETSSEVGSSDTPPPIPKSAQQRLDSNAAESTTTQLQSTLTELNTLPSVGMGLGAGAGPILPGDSTSDRDSSSIHMDRNSTTADTLSLSRNTSMSSIIAPEKSIDGDEILGDIDTESVSGGTVYGLTAPQDGEAIGNEFLLASVQPPIVPTLSSGSVPPPSASFTAMSREEQSATPSSSASNPAAPGVEEMRRVENAMSKFQHELKHILTSSSYPQMIEENRVLKDQRMMVDQENVRLREELSNTRKELHATKEENSRLSSELKKLRSSLSALAQPTLETTATATTPSLAQSVSTSSSTSTTVTRPSSSTPVTAAETVAHTSGSTSSELATPSFSPQVTPAPSASNDPLNNIQPPPQDGT